MWYLCRYRVKEWKSSVAHMHVETDPCMYVCMSVCPLLGDDCSHFRCMINGVMRGNSSLSLYIFCLPSLLLPLFHLRPSFTTFCSVSFAPSFSLFLRDFQSSLISPTPLCSPNINDCLKSVSSNGAAPRVAFRPGDPSC